MISAGRETGCFYVIRWINNMEKYIEFLKRFTEGDMTILYSHRCGLCYNAAMFAGNVEWAIRIRQDCKDWIYFSGDVRFPVEGSAEYYSDRLLYTGRAYQLRISLAKHLLGKVS